MPVRTGLSRWLNNQHASHWHGTSLTVLMVDTPSSHADANAMTEDPGAFFRSMLGEWEKMANGVGGDLLKSEEWSRAMGMGTATHVQMQGAVKDAMARALAAANMPSRADFEDLSARIGRMEASLARIEAAVAASADIDKPKPTRNRKPPTV